MNAIKPGTKCYMIVTDNDETPRIHEGYVRKTITTETMDSSARMTDPPTVEVQYVVACRQDEFMVSKVFLEAEDIIMHLEKKFQEDKGGYLF